MPLQITGRGYSDEPHVNFDHLRHHHGQRGGPHWGLAEYEAA
jgi:hypothetical protein